MKKNNFLPKLFLTILVVAGGLIYWSYRAPQSPLAQMTAPITLPVHQFVISMADLMGITLPEAFYSQALGNLNLSKTALAMLAKESGSDIAKNPNSNASAASTMPVVGNGSEDNSSNGNQGTGNIANSNGAGGSMAADNGGNSAGATGSGGQATGGLNNNAGGSSNNPNNNSGSPDNNSGGNPNNNSGGNPDNNSGNPNGAAGNGNQGTGGLPDNGNPGNGNPTNNNGTGGTGTNPFNTGSGSGTKSNNGSNNSETGVCVPGCYAGCIPGCDPQCTSDCWRVNSGTSADTEVCVPGCYPGCIPGCDPQCTPGCLSGPVPTTTSTPSGSGNQNALPVINTIPSDTEVAQGVAQQNQQASQLAALIAHQQALTDEVMTAAAATKYESIDSDTIPAPDNTPAPDDIVQKIRAAQLIQH